MVEAEAPYFLRRREDSVSWRRDSAEERLEREVERERRRRVVEVSISSRSVSVRLCCWGWVAVWGWGCGLRCGRGGWVGVR